MVTTAFTQVLKPADVSLLVRTRRPAVALDVVRNAMNQAAAAPWVRGLSEQQRAAERAARRSQELAKRQQKALEFAREIKLQRIKVQQHQARLAHPGDPARNRLVALLSQA